MHIHHLNCGAMQPYGGALMDGRTPGVSPATMTCHCLLLESCDGLVLVDTGTVSTDPNFDRAQLDPTVQWMNRIRLEAREAAANQVRALGHDPEDVRDIIMTHLDFDHAAGLRDFPRATVHLSTAEAHAARHSTGPLSRRRYRPAQWGDIGRWRRYAAFDTDWFGIPAADVTPEISLVWLPGHTDGHCGVAIRTSEGWLLHAADAISTTPNLPSAPARRPGRGCING